jgi:ABC-type molybdate transport system substrate-binding protein
MSAKHIAIGALAVFMLAVAALTMGGRQMLQTLEQADATVSYLDLARQSTQQRQYEQADAYYKQACNYAATTVKKRENMALALTQYSEFLRKKRNPLKNEERAKELEQRAVALSQQTL